MRKRNTEIPKTQYLTAFENGIWMSHKELSKIAGSNIFPCHVQHLRRRHMVLLLFVTLTDLCCFLFKLQTTICSTKHEHRICDMDTSCSTLYCDIKSLIYNKVCEKRQMCSLITLTFSNFINTTNLKIITV